MSSCLIDTDVTSFLFKNDTRAQRLIPFLSTQQVNISFMTEAELEQWILLARWGQERTLRFRNFLRRFTIIPSSHDLSQKWADAMVTARNAGRRMETADAWIAATALLYKIPLVTNNVADFFVLADLQIIGR